MATQTTEATIFSQLDPKLVERYSRWNSIASSARALRQRDFSEMPFRSSDLYPYLGDLAYSLSDTDNPEAHLLAWLFVLEQKLKLFSPVLATALLGSIEQELGSLLGALTMQRQAIVSNILRTAAVLDSSEE